MHDPYLHVVRGSADVQYQLQQYIGACGHVYDDGIHQYIHACTTILTSLHQLNIERWAGCRAAWLCQVAAPASSKEWRNQLSYLAAGDALEDAQGPGLHSAVERVMQCQVDHTWCQLGSCNQLVNSLVAC